MFACSGPLSPANKFRVPKFPTVPDAYANDASVVDVLLNVLSAVNVFVVYVFGIVVLELTKEFIELFKDVESTVNAPPTFERPVPSKLLNDEPFITRFVVLAVLNDPYVVEENANVCSAAQVFAVVVPKARLIVSNVLTKGYVNVSAEPPPVTQLPFIAKHPPVKLMPFAKVEEAVVEVTERRFVEIPPTNVEVAVEVEINEFAITVPPTESF